MGRRGGEGGGIPDESFFQPVHLWGQREERLSFLNRSFVQAANDYLALLCTWDSLRSGSGEEAGDSLVGLGPIHGVHQPVGKKRKDSCPPLRVLGGV